IGAVITVAALPALDSVIGWLFLRFLNGLCGAVPWVVTETWINAIAMARTRGRITALYGGFMAIGFAIGPFLLTTVGTDGALPFLYFAALMSLSLIPIIIVRHLAPVLHLPHGAKISGFFLTVPTVMGAGFICGMTDTSLFSFLPIWSKQAGVDEETAIQLLSIFVVGNVFMTLPLGWLADRTNKRMVLIGCSIMCIIGPFAVTIMAPTMVESLWIVGILLFLWGGCAWALYTVGLAMLGERFQAGSLAASNAAFVVAYEIANIAGPPAAGFAMDTWESHGLMTFMGSAAAIYTVVAIGRGMIRQRQSR
nr:MFS transporter [Alphaproteobacteria bacterium]